MITSEGIVTHPFDSSILWRSPVFSVDAKITTNTDTGLMILDVVATAHKKGVESVEITSTNPETLEPITAYTQIERYSAIGKVFWNDATISGASSLPMTMANLQLALESWVMGKLQESNIDVTFEIV